MAINLYAAEISDTGRVEESLINDTQILFIILFNSNKTSLKLSMTNGNLNYCV